ncbi:MAG: PAS domain-containing protein, partial [Desulfovibrionaceae bacterium]|nr:PAS domain-containing protein [Desulfovibrionaceae bacterium]
KAQVLDLIQVQKARFTASYESQQQDAAGARQILLGVAVLIFAILLATVLFINRRIGSPLAAMIDFSQKIAAGDFSAVLTGSYAREFEALKRNLTVMTDELKSSLGFSHSVMRGFRQPFLTVDIKGDITFVNQPALNLLDIAGSPEAFVGKTTGEFFYDDAGRETEIVRLMRSGKWNSSADTVLTSRAGRKVNVRADRCQLNDLTGKMIGGISTYMDLTSIVESQQLALTQSENLREVAAEAGGIAAGLFDFSERLSTQVEQVALGAKHQKDQTERTSSAMGSMNDSVMLISRSAESAAAEASSTEEKALAGAKVVEKSVASIHRVAGVSSDLGITMQELGQQSESIGRVLAVISDIADQTNLLALNAAIEAARAGDAGRGFAVVADEVRKLAEKTMLATRDVDEKINAIQDSAKHNIERMTESIGLIQEAAGLVNESGGALTQIVALARRSAACSKDIVTASREQAETAREITGLAQEVQRIADETDEGMASAATSVEHLTTMAGSLKGLVDRLKSS